MNFIGQLLGNLKKKSVFFFSRQYLGCYLADMHLISRYNKELDIFYVLLICLVTMLLLFL